MMKYLFSVLVVGALLAPTAAAQPASGPDFDLLARLSGDHVYDFTNDAGTSPGTISYRVMDGGRAAAERTPGLKLRTFWKGIGTDNWTFHWEASENGGPWREMSHGRARPAK